MKNAIFTSKLIICTKNSTIIEKITTQYPITRKPEPKMLLPEATRIQFSTSGSTRTEPYLKSYYPNRTETRKSATRSDPTYIHTYITQYFTSQNSNL